MSSPRADVLPVLLGLLLAAAAPCSAQTSAQSAAPAPGAWVVRGHDERLGRYEGLVRLGPDGRFAGDVRFVDGAEGSLEGRAALAGDGRLAVDGRLRKRVEDRRGISGVLARVGVHRERTVERVGATRYREDAGAWIGAYLARGRDDERRGVERWGRAPAAQTLRLKVMTWNVLGFTSSWPAREGKIAALIRREAPDVVCLQEVNGVTRGNGTQAARLARAAGGYEVVFEGARSRTFLGLGWEGNAVLVRGKVLERARCELPVGDAELGALRRVVTLARVELRPGLAMDVVSTHLHQKHDDAGKAHRLAQGRALLRWLQARPARGPRLIAGDFNEGPGGSLLPLLTGTGRFLDAWTAANPGQDGGTSSAGRRIDYLFFQDPGHARGERVKVRRAWRLGPNERGDEGATLSDHRAVVAEVEVTLPR